jgi:iron complex outermembrane receptor protein
MTHELRLASTDPASRLKWLLGAYYYHLDTEELRTVAANKSFNITDQPSRALAAYGQVTYSVTDPLRVTGGIRFSRIDKSVTGSRFTPGPSTANPTPIPFSADFKWNHVDWKVGADYDLTPNSMLYATVQTGYLGGGVNFFNSPLQSNEVKPENLLAYSLGMKNSFFGKTLRLNWEAFYYDWKNYQVGVFGVAAGTNIVFNAPKSRSYGFELDADWRITSNDHASLGFGYFHGKFTDFVVPRGVSSPVRDYVFTGYALPFAPNWTINGQYDHTFRLAGGSRLVATGSVQYTSKFWTSFSHGITRCVNVPPTVLTQDQCVDIGVLQPSLALVNLDLTWHSRDDRWNVSVWARNLTDKAIRTSGGDGGMTPAGIVTTLAASTLGPPRTYGARVGLSW